MRTGLTSFLRPRARLTFWEWLHGRLVIRAGRCPVCDFRWVHTCDLCSPYWRAYPHRRPGDRTRPSPFILAHWWHRYREMCFVSRAPMRRIRFASFAEARAAGARVLKDYASVFRSLALRP